MPSMLLNADQLREEPVFESGHCCIPVASKGVVLVVEYGFRLFELPVTRAWKQAPTAVIGSVRWNMGLRSCFMAAVNPSSSSSHRCA